MDIQKSQTIPVKKGWPLLGILPAFLSGDPFEYLRNVMLEKGDFVQLNFGPKPVYLVSHPDYFKRILQDNYNNYYKPGMLYDSAREVAGNGLVVSSGDYWLRQRRMIQPFLHRKNLVHLFSDMYDSILEVLSDWTSLAEKGTEVDLGQKMGELTMSVTARTLFGKDTVPVEEYTRVGRSIMQIIKYMGDTLYSGIVPKWFPIPGRQEYLRNVSEAKEMVHQIIAKCRENKEESASLILMLINAVDEESHQKMTEQQLFDEVVTILIAGYETTATALTWLGVVVQNHPDILEKLHLEIDQVFVKGKLSFEDVPNLTYTRQVFMEILRMYTTAPFMARGLSKADQLGDYSLPADALILVFLHGVHHNPEFWENPEVFDPERFTPERIANQRAFTFMPFSAGPHKCAGNEFALLEGTMIIAMLLQKYDLNVLPNQIFTPRTGGTMRPGNGIKTTLSIRTLA